MCDKRIGVVHGDRGQAHSLLDPIDHFKKFILLIKLLILVLVFIVVFILLVLIVVLIVCHLLCADIDEFGDFCDALLQFLLRKLLGQSTFIGHVLYAQFTLFIDKRITGPEPAPPGLGVGCSLSG